MRSSCPRVSASGRKKPTLFWRSFSESTGRLKILVKLNSGGLSGHPQIAVQQPAVVSPASLQIHACFLEIRVRLGQPPRGQTGGHAKKRISQRKYQFCPPTRETSLRFAKIRQQPPRSRLCA